jgi:hypothetical protein
MKDNILSLAAGAVENARVHILPIGAPRRRPAAAALPARGRKNSAPNRDYFVSIGSTTYQVSITTVDGARLFRLRRSGRFAI